MKPNFIKIKFIPELKASLSLALPLIASNLASSLSGFVSTAMVAYLGKDQLAANVLVWSFYVVVVLFFTGILSSVSIIISQNHGAQNSNGITVCFKQGLILAIVFIFPMSLIMWFSPFMLTWMSQKQEIVYIATPFFRSMIWAILPLNIMFLLQQFLIGITRAKIVMWINLGRIIMEILFCYMFLFGKFGAPKIGLAGIGYALALTYYIVSIFCCCYLLFSNHFKHYHLFTRLWQFNKKIFFEIVNIGIYSGFLYCIDVTFLAVIALMMGFLGTTYLAAYQIAYQYLVVAVSIIFALTQATTIRVSYEAGKKNFSGIKTTIIVNYIIALATATLFSITYICFPRLAISMDLDVNAPNLYQLVKTTEMFLSLIGILIIPECIRIISFGALRGLKDTRFPMLAGIIGFGCIAFPLSYLMALKFNLRGSGILSGFIIGAFVAAGILVIRLNHLIKRINLNNTVTK